MEERIDVLDIVIKVAEICNSNCTYCYYFKKENKDYLGKPNLIKENIIEKIAEYIKNAVTTYKVSQVYLGFHGGEALLLGKKRFNKMVQIFYDKLSNLSELNLSLQTNGMLLDDEWIDLFDKHQISVSVSLDGDERIHDKHRIDKGGRGTYQRVVNGFNLLHKARQQNKIPPGGVICVINPQENGGYIYRHFINNIGIDYVSFIEQDYTLDNVPLGFSENVKRYYAELFEEWEKYNKEKINPNSIVRNFFYFLGRMLDKDAKKDPELRTVVLTFHTDGTVEPDDELRHITHHFNLSYFNVVDSKLSDYLSDPNVQQFLINMNMLPDACKECVFKNICQGGNKIGSCLHRFNFENKFNNKNIYCDSYKLIFLKLCDYMMKRGMSYDSIEEALS